MEDNVRDFVNRLKNKAVNMSAAAESTIRQAGKATGETMEVAKLNMKIFDLNGEISLNYKKLGEMIYATHKGREIPEAELEALISEIDEKLSEIAQYRERINVMKKVVSCPVCQNSCGKDDRFCRKCGAEL